MFSPLAFNTPSAQPWSRHINLAAGGTGGDIGSGRMLVYIGKQLKRQYTVEN